MRPLKGTGTAPAEEAAAAAARPSRQLLRDELGEVAVDLVGADHHPLAGDEPALPPQGLHPLLGGEGVAEAGGKLPLGPAVDHAVLEDEGDLARIDVDQPVVVPPACPRPLDPVGLLLEPRGHLEVPGAPDALHLLADPYRV